MRPANGQKKTDIFYRYQNIFFQPSELNCTELTEVVTSSAAPRGGDWRRRARVSGARDPVMEAPPSPGVATVSAISPFWRHNTATGHKGAHTRSVHIRT